MDVANERYTTGVRQAEEQLLHFLRTFEAVQEDIHIARAGESQRRMRDAVGETLAQLTTELAALTPPEAVHGFHTKLREAVALCADSHTTFLNAAGPSFAQSFLDSRQALCRGLYLLYEIRAQLPVLQQHWVLPAAVSSLPTIEATSAGVDALVGFSHKPRTNTHAEYSLYVPENYTPQQTWPLIICLHGGYGRGDDYIWTWLRPAKSKGYILLSPKSTGPTWSVLNPPVDVRSIQAMFDEVCATYAVDRKRVYLTGLSDGGIFTYLLGLIRAELFAGMAPIAGELHPMTDNMLRRGLGKEVPMLIVHGAQDFIFDVSFTRQTQDLLQRLGYKVTYQELPDWGHAYTYTINEQRVLPWFESLVRE
jgi:phospholipase/carboxylesterase